MFPGDWHDYVTLGVIWCSIISFQHDGFLGRLVEQLRFFLLLNVGVRITMMLIDYTSGRQWCLSCNYTKHQAGMVGEA